MFRRRSHKDFQQEIESHIELEATMNARILLLKGIHERQQSEYSDFKKFSVETSLKVIEGAPASR